jgi:hypothetical protein
MQLFGYLILLLALGRLLAAPGRLVLGLAGDARGAVDRVLARARRLRARLQRVLNVHQ